MKTRNNGCYVEGRYNHLAKSCGHQAFYERTASQRNGGNRNQTVNLSELVNSLNYNILNLLKISKSAGLIRSFKTEINTKIMNYLANKYKLTCRYQLNQPFFDDLNLINERKINERCNSVIDRDYLLVKVMKKKDIYQGNKKTRGLRFLSIKFSKHYSINSDF